MGGGGGGGEAEGGRVRRGVVSGRSYERFGRVDVDK